MSKQWLKDQLHQHHVEVDDEILQYILSIPNPTDAAEYLSHITNLPVGSKFIKEFVSQNGFSNSSSSKSQAQPQSASNKKKAKNPNPNPNSNPNPNNQTKKTNNNAPGSVQVYKKPDIESQVYFQGYFHSFFLSFIYLFFYIVLHNIDCLFFLSFFFF